MIDDWLSGVITYLHERFIILLWLSHILTLSHREQLWLLIPHNMQNVNMSLVDSFEGTMPGIDSDGHCFVDACDCDSISWLGHIYHFVKAEHCHSMGCFSLWNCIGILLQPSKQGVQTATVHFPCNTHLTGATTTALPFFTRRFDDGLYQSIAKRGWVVSMRQAATFWNACAQFKEILS